MRYRALSLLLVLYLLKPRSSTA